MVNGSLGAYGDDSDAEFRYFESVRFTGSPEVPKISRPAAVNELFLYDMTILPTAFSFPQSYLTLVHGRDLPDSLTAVVE